MDTIEICYNGIDDNGDGLVDAADPQCKKITVTTSNDVLDGDTSSVEQLMANPGADGFISLREAIAATQSVTSRDSFHIIGFRLFNYDQKHLYYPDDGQANQVSLPIRTTAIDDSALSNKDPDYPHSWFQFNLQTPLPALSDNVLIDGFDLRQAQPNTNPIGRDLNSVIRIEIVANGNFPVFQINQAQLTESEIIIRGLSLHSPTEVIAITGGEQGKIWLHGNYIGIFPNALNTAPIRNSIINIRHSNRPIIIGSNKDGLNDDGEVNLIAGAQSSQAGVFLENSSQVTIRGNYFGIGLKGNNQLGNGEGIGIRTIASRDNNFDKNIISFLEAAFHLTQAKSDSIQNNLLGVHSVDQANLVLSNHGGICLQCDSLTLFKNTIGNSLVGWEWQQSTDNQIIENEIFGNLTIGLAFIDEENVAPFNKYNFIYKNKIHHNLIGILLGSDANDNTLLQNSIYANANIGIDLSELKTEGDGITPNDLNDLDNGANRLLNFPELTINDYNITSVTIEVDLDINNLTASTVDAYRIEFFANSSKDDRGGEVYLGNLDIDGDVANRIITLPLPLQVSPDYSIAATTSIIKNTNLIATLPQKAFGASSEFSPPIPLPLIEICDNGIDDDGDNLIDCADSDCENYATAGEISGAESSCLQIYLPEKIENILSPQTDIRESVFYQWQKSLDSGENWESILKGTAATYPPDSIQQSIQYRRLVKKHACNSWLSSNIIEKKIKPLPITNIISAPDESKDLCEANTYTFLAADPNSSQNYSWKFGTYANQNQLVGIGPHSVSYQLPSDSSSLKQQAILIAEKEGCLDSITLNYTLRSLLQTETISPNAPTTCSGSDGSINVLVKDAAMHCIALSIDGGSTYLPDNQLTATNLSAGDYHLVIRYCDALCEVDLGMIKVQDPPTILIEEDTLTASCPGVLMKGDAGIPDSLQAIFSFSILSNPDFGVASIDETGAFTYSPTSNHCGIDQFSYEACNTHTNCCATARITVKVGDKQAPIIENLPLDLTLGTDDLIPMPATPLAIDNCPTAELDFLETDTKGAGDCNPFSYHISRTWTASDQCDNTASHTQIIEIIDQTAPDIFKIHTLPNGEKMVAAIMEFTSEHWKTIRFPISFDSYPVLFTQLVTINEASTSTVQIRNVTSTHFEIRLQEAANQDGIHQKESIAWIAMERGSQSENYLFQADTLSVTHAWTNIPFAQNFATVPLFFANMQSTKEADVATLRNNSVLWNKAKVRIQEEQSIDSNTAHEAETTGYLAIENIGNLTDNKGRKIGEVGRKKITSEWTNIPLSSRYNNPVVIANSLSIDHFDPATVRIANITPDSFSIRIEEWEYLDGNHGTETVSYMVIEGSLPLATSHYCETKQDAIDFSEELIALDNMGQVLEIVYEENLNTEGTQYQTIRQWKAVDTCGNKEVVTQINNCTGIALKAKTVLQGALMESPNPTLMRDDLRKLNLIPLEEPYANLDSFQHHGSGGNEILKESLLTIADSNAIVDWVFLELRDKADKKQVLATASALVQRDGDIISANGDSIIVFATLPPDDYYVAVRHRNHICMLSQMPHSFSENNIPFLDFTIPSTTTSVIGDSLRIPMWAGDLNQDGSIVFQGPNNDIFHIFLTIVTDPLNTRFIPNFISKGYVTGDLNLDGQAAYLGPQNEPSILLFNTILVHPANTSFFSNFIIGLDKNGGG